MNTQSTTTELTLNLQTAEAVVAIVKDPKLREIAFGCVLKHLLGKKKGDPVEPAVAAPLGRVKKSVRPSSSNGTMAWLNELVSEGFFSQPKSVKQIIQELSNRSHHLRGADLTRQLQQLCHDRMLRRRKQAASEGGKEVFHWSNW
jgi:hypothetical protein